MAWEIVHVPEKLPSSLDPPTADVFAAMIEPRLANTLVRQLNQICPLQNLRHVKRVRRRSTEGKVELAVILCLSLEYRSYDESIPADMRKFVTANQSLRMLPLQKKNGRSNVNFGLHHTIHKTMLIVLLDLLKKIHN